MDETLKMIFRHRRRRLSLRNQLQSQSASENSFAFSPLSVREKLSVGQSVERMARRTRVATKSY
jgi:hypothetical protein